MSIVDTIRSDLTTALAWVADDPVSELAWTAARRTAEDYLYTRWHAGDLRGDKPELAYYVKCDHTTMTQNDLDLGHFVMQVGVAPTKPAEFVVFTIEFTRPRPLRPGGGALPRR